MSEHYITLIGASDYNFLEHFYIIILQLHQLDSIASQPACLPAYQPAYQPANLPVIQPASQPPSQPAYLPDSLLASQPAIQLASLPACQPASLPASQLSSQWARLPIHIGLNIHCTLYGHLLNHWIYTLLDILLVEHSSWLPGLFEFIYPCLN